MNIQFDEEIKTSGLSIRLGCLKMQVITAPADETLKRFVTESISRISGKIEISSVNQIDTIRETRLAYKTLGKDPSRYRPSAESLIRRIMKSKALYEINAIVDLLNIISVETGFSIGGYDFSKIHWPVILSKGKPDDKYEGLGRGRLNIENLPVLRDELGAFGCPTSDSYRTSVTGTTSEFLMVFFSFGENGHNNLPDVLDWCAGLYEKYTSSVLIEKQVLSQERSA